jgi:hypothetical protein
VSEPELSSDAEKPRRNAVLIGIKVDARVAKEPPGVHQGFKVACGARLQHALRLRHIQTATLANSTSGGAVLRFTTVRSGNKVM